MKRFSLEFPLFDNEIKMLSHFLDRAKNGYGEYEGDDGWLHNQKSIDIIENQLLEMEKNRLKSKYIILDVLNSNNKYPLAVKLFYISGVQVVANEKNPLLYEGEKFYELIYTYTPIIKDIMIDFIKSNDYKFDDRTLDVLNGVIARNKIEEFADKISHYITFSMIMKNNEDFSYVVKDYVDMNFEECAKLYENFDSNNENKEKVDEYKNVLEKTKTIYKELKENRKIDVVSNYLYKDIIDKLEAKIKIYEDVQNNECIIDKNLIEKSNSIDDSFIRFWNKSIEKDAVKCKSNKYMDNVKC